MLRYAVAATTLLFNIGTAVNIGTVVSTAPRQPTSRPNHVRTPPPPLRPPTMQRIFAPLPSGAWTDAEIILNNNSPNEMSVRPTVYRRGVAASAQPLVLQPAEVRWITLGELTGSAGNELLANEAIELASMGHTLELGAQVILRRARGAGSVDIPFSGAIEFRSSVQEAVWPSPAGSRAVVAIGNASDVTITIGIQASGGRSEVIELGPHGTRTVVNEAAAGTSEPGWMRLDLRGAAASVRAAGFVERAGRSVGGIRFYDPQTVRQPNLFATNLRVGDTRPVLALKNTTGDPVTVIPRFRPFGGHGVPFDLAPVVIPARRAVNVDMAALVTEAGFRRDLGRVSVEIVNTGPAGSLIGGLSAVSRDGRQSFDVPLRDSGPVNHGTGSYPWRIDGDATTTVTLTNVSDRPAKYHARINYPGGTYWFAPADVAVGETVSFDLRHIHDDAVPDMHGHVLPASVTAGQFRWSTVKSHGDTQLTGRAELVSAAADRSSSYSCWICCYDSVDYGYLSPSSFGVPLDNSTDIETMEHWYDCYGNSEGDFNTAYAESWWVQDSNIVAMSTPETGFGRADGSSDGASDVQGSWTYEYAYPDPNDNWETCIFASSTIDAPGNATALVPTYVSILGTPQYTQGPPAPYVYNINRQILDQNHAPLNGVRHVTESFSPDPPSGNCTSQAVDKHDANSDQYGIFGPDLYSLPGNAPNPCSSTSVQSLKVDGRSVTPTYDVNWRYSGVTVTAR